MAPDPRIRETYKLRIREISKLVPGQSRLRGRSRRHPSLATDAQAWRGPCAPPASRGPAPPSLFAGPANPRISGSSVGRLAHAPSSALASPPSLLPPRLLGFRALRTRMTNYSVFDP